MDLSSSTAGLRTFVNTLGAVHNLKGRHGNWNDSTFALKRRWWNYFAICTIKKASIFLLKKGFYCMKTLHLEVL